MLEKNYCRLSDHSTTYVDQSKPKELKIDDYTICPQSLLGTGSFSSVYMCKDESGNRGAVKILKKRGDKSQNTIIKVARTEAKTMKKLNHPNIAKYLGSYESERHYYILFEYCQGKTLREINKITPLMPVPQLRNLAICLIKALKYLNDKRIMHRDLKPENIKIYHRQIKLLDFGFACELPHGEKTVLHDSVGTPSYMSPEMLQRKNYTSNSDIWSLGVVLYEAAYGRLPWNGRNQSQLLKSIQLNEIRLPKYPSIPDYLKKLIAGCLEKKSGDRICWGSLFNFLNDLPQLEEEKKQILCSICSWF